MEKGRVYAGQRNRRVEIEKFTTAKNALNEDVKTPVSVGFFWAAMEDLTGDEQEEGKVIYVVNRSYTILFNQEVKDDGEEMTLKDEGKDWQIFYVKEIGRKVQLTLKCTAVKRE